jgi:hypothetical protein
LVVSTARLYDKGRRLGYLEPHSGEIREGLGDDEAVALAQELEA